MPGQAEVQYVKPDLRVVDAVNELLDRLDEIGVDPDETASFLLSIAIDLWAMQHGRADAVETTHLLADRLALMTRDSDRARH